MEETIIDPGENTETERREGEKWEGGREGNHGHVKGGQHKRGPLDNDNDELQISFLHSGFDFLGFESTTTTFRPATSSSL